MKISAVRNLKQSRSIFVLIFNTRKLGGEPFVHFNWVCNRESSSWQSVCPSNSAVWFQLNHLVSIQSVKLINLSHQFNSDQFGGSNPSKLIIKSSPKKFSNFFLIFLKFWLDLIFLRTVMRNNRTKTVDRFNCDLVWNLPSFPWIIWYGLMMRSAFNLKSLNNCTHLSLNIDCNYWAFILLVNK